MAPRRPGPWRWDGKTVRPFRGGVSLEDRGFRYGHHVFESVATRSGRILLGEEHLDLLELSARRHGIPLSGALRSALSSFLTSRVFPDGMLRIYLTAGSGEVSSRIRKPACYLVHAPARFPSLPEIRRGWSLDFPGTPFLGGTWGEKNGNYLPHVQILHEARQRGLDEAVVTDARGRVLSCATGNLLVWLPSGKRPRLVTPPAACGAREGAVLGWVKRRHDVGERVLRAADLLGAVALAVTNSRLGVMPVSSLGGRIPPRPDLPLGLARDYLFVHGLHGRP